MTESFTIRKYRALKECPQGQLPGDVFEATEAAGNVLISVGAAELVADTDPPSPPKPYKRRDQKAEA